MESEMKSAEEKVEGYATKLLAHLQDIGQRRLCGCGKLEGVKLVDSPCLLTPHVYRTMAAWALNSVISNLAVIFTCPECGLEMHYNFNLVCQQIGLSLKKGQLAMLWLQGTAEKYRSAQQAPRPEKN